MCHWQWTGLFVPLLTTLRALVESTRRHAMCNEPSAAAENHSGLSSRPEVLLTVTSRLDRAETFEAEARSAGWAIEHVPIVAPGTASRAGASATVAMHVRMLRLRLIRDEPDAEPGV